MGRCTRTPATQKEWNKMCHMGGRPQKMCSVVYVGTRRNYFYSADGAGREAGHAYVLE